MNRSINWEKIRENQKRTKNGIDRAIDATINFESSLDSNWEHGVSLWDNRNIVCDICVNHSEFLYNIVKNGSQDASREKLSKIISANILLRKILQSNQQGMVDRKLEIFLGMWRSFKMELRFTQTNLDVVKKQQLSLREHLDVSVTMPHFWDFVYS